MASAQDVYETTTAAIVRAIEEGAGTWRMPWTAEGLAFPSNPTTGKRYRGGNVLTLWLSALQQGYTLGEWATYKQWKSIGALFFARRENDDTAEEEGTRARFIANRFVVFNAAQVEGYTPRIAQRDTFEQIERAEQFFAAIGAQVEHRNEGRAYYRPSDDLIVLPPFETFTDAPSYYATSAHEHAHWTGHASRLARTYGERFGDDAYAVEELTAELSAAFTCAALGISTTTRPDHAAYLSGWLKVLKSDARALHSIASKAQAATDYLLSAAGLTEETTTADTPAAA